MSSALVCRCGAPLISDGTTWRCPLRGTVNAFTSGDVHSGDEEPDFRPLNTHQQPAPKVGRPGRHGSKRHHLKRCRLHKGPMAGCRNCSGEYKAEKFNKMVARLKTKFGGRA